VNAAGCLSGFQGCEQQPRLVYCSLWESLANFTPDVNSDTFFDVLSHLVGMCEFVILHDLSFFLTV